MNTATATEVLGEPLEMAAFSPVAYFDKHMDCIRVIVRDCSVTEHRIDEMFTLMEDNHPNRFGHRYVGFTIKGVRHLFDELDLPLGRVYKIADILHEIVKKWPTSTIAIVSDVILDSADESSDLAVDMAA
ncbi:hypothetical protein A3194_20130 [Candidatus Thiodiazotropha endoloripes]|uniref:hypothetical protein n=1 Tax=Candidatus Thiodiazotropha endoloripes TaxID=1818881 RepID=UPI00083DA1FD|nr:hypothetical protein [Candidatus Thiodiazotropha endoloripes]ODB94974.1 hypothetical protein A3194_20130 [Candidatus Thiodiazotropha endoloripes]